MRLLEAHDWPGNVRELQAAVRYAAARTPPATLVTPECLPEGVRPGRPRACQRRRPASTALDLGELVAGLLRAGEDDVYRKVLLEADRVILEAALRHTRGNQGQASELLGISRTTLRAKLRAAGICLERLPLTESGRSG